MATAEGAYPKVGGDPIYASELNARAYGNVEEVYTGTGFDSSGIADSDDHELNAITAGNLANKLYVKISITVTATNGSDTVNAASCQLKLQAKETGGAYADEFGFKTLTNSNTWYERGGGTQHFGTIVWYHTLTAGEKTNGVQFKVFSQTTGTATATVTNVCTAVETIGR